MDGERLYLLGHGFTPHFQVTYPDGTVRDYSQPFAPEPNDPNFTSQGAVKILDPPGATGDEVRKQQLAIVGIFAPTALLHGAIMTSSFPAADNPGVAVDVYRGDLGMEGGRSQSVFAIDTSQVDKGLLTKQARANLMLGESHHPRRRHPDHLHRLQRVGVAADLLRPGAGVGAGLRGDAAGRPDGVAGVQATPGVVPAALPVPMAAPSTS